MSQGSDAVAQLEAVMHRLRHECPWDAEQTPRSLLPYLIEETGEVVDAVESGSDADAAEEWGDLLLQVMFHAEIAAEEGRFTLAQIADGIREKLVRRHPHVFADADVPDDKNSAWEAAKRQEKNRTSSLDGIAEHLSGQARLTKVITRARHHRVPVDLPTEPIDAAELSAAVTSLAARAQASGIDVEQVTRDATRALETQVRDAESAG